MKFRPPLKITSRTSSITNSFVQAIIPNVKPTETELEEALAVLGMSLKNRSCVYCGVSATDWDHLRPLVKYKRPTGFLNEARNLVPSCAPATEYVAMPDGSSSAAPVMIPGPSDFSSGRIQRDGRDAATRTLGCAFPSDQFARDIRAHRGRAAPNPPREQ